MTPPSNAPSESLERIIARVVRDVLQGTPGTGGAAPAAEASEQRRPAATLQITEGVLTLSALDGRLDGIRRLVVAERCVVTPAARDELRGRGIALVRATDDTHHSVASAVPNRSVPTAQHSAPDAAATRMLADVDREDRTAGFARQLAMRGLAATESGSLERLLPRLVDPAARAVVLANLPQPVVCEACRHAHVRAAQVSAISSVARLATAMRPNLWVLDMETLNFSGAVAAAAACFRAPAGPASNR